MAQNVGDHRPVHRPVRRQGTRRLSRRARTLARRDGGVNARADKLAGRLPGAEVDAVLITDLVNVRYLTGYTGSNGLALIARDTRRVFVTDFRYVEQAAEEVDPGFDRLKASVDLLEAIKDALPTSGELRLGFEEAHVSVREHGRLRELLPDRVE